MGKWTYFINTSTNDLYLTNKIKTDALICSIQEKGIIAFKVKRIFQGSKLIFSSSTPISIAMKETLITTLTYSAPEETQIQLYSKLKPKNIELNNELQTTWIYKNSCIELTIPRGNGEIKILHN